MYFVLMINTNLSLGQLSVTIVGESVFFILAPLVLHQLIIKLAIHSTPLSTGA
jgi:hypothetical protein